MFELLSINILDRKILWGYFQSLPNPYVMEGFFFAMESQFAKNVDHGMTLVFFELPK